MMERRKRLYAEFDIHPATHSCPVCCLDRDVTEVRHLLSNGTCHVELIRGPETCECPDREDDCSDEDDCLEIQSRRVDVPDDCYCAVFADYGCIPEVTGTQGATVRIETYLPDKQYLTDLVDDLRESTDGVELRRLKRTNAASADYSSDTVTLDVGDITEKQKEAVMVAVAEGYYSRPREGSLEDLAEALGVTKSAVTQRLNAVESKLAVSAFSELAPGD